MDYLNLLVFLFTFIFCAYAYMNNGKKALYFIIYVFFTYLSLLLFNNLSEIVNYESDIINYLAILGFSLVITLSMVFFKSNLFEFKKLDVSVLGAYLWSMLLVFYPQVLLLFKNSEDKVDVFNYLMVFSSIQLFLLLWLWFSKKSRFTLNIIRLSVINFVLIQLVFYIDFFKSISVLTSPALLKQPLYVLEIFSDLNILDLVFLSTSVFNIFILLATVVFLVECGLNKCKDKSSNLKMPYADNENIGFYDSKPLPRKIKYQLLGYILISAFLIFYSNFNIFFIIGLPTLFYTLKSSL